MEGLFGENITFPELRWRFFVRRQQEDESLTHFAVALWKLLKKCDVRGCANITKLDHLLKDQLVVGMKASQESPARAN